MESELELTLAAFNKTIDQWISILSGYSMKNLLRQPESGWNLGQVILHINRQNEFYLEQMRSALSSHAIGEKTEEGQWMFEHNQFPDARLDNPFNHNLPQPESKEQLMLALLLMRKDVNALYNEQRGSLPPGMTRHPGLGYFSSLDWLRFLEMHMRHHFKQKERIEATN